MTQLRSRAVGGGAHVRAGVGRAAGLLAAASGDDISAGRVFDEALTDDVADAGAFARARLELAAGAFRRRAGQRRAAATLLEAALKRFHVLGAAPYQARAAQELAACGLNPRARNEAGAPTLTRAEATVAALVADGRTNREVAAQLVVSVKTVESHLARVFAKLGVRSRTELANRWRAESMPTP